MRKTLLFAVLLLLISTLPAVSAPNPHISIRPVTFAGDLVHACDLEVYEHKKTLSVDDKPINYTCTKVIDLGGTDFKWLSENWLDAYDAYFAGWEEKYGKPLNYFGRLYLRAEKGTGEALIVSRFGRITTEDPPHSGLFKYHLEGSGTWSEADGMHTITSSGDFTIYELSWRGKKRAKTTYTEVWAGSLTFDIEIGP